MTSAGDPSQHGALTSASPGAPAQPSLAEQARTLLHLGRVGTLSTLSRTVVGFPFGSIAPYGLDACARPTFLFSSLAMHTQNLAADARASMLVTSPGWSEDPLAGPRVTVIGSIAPVPPADTAGVRADYLARHAGARHWVDFADFAFYRLQVLDLYFVAGFGAMGWVQAADYLQANPDPLADSAAGIVAHMNADHADALILYSHAFGGIAADAAVMTAVDRLGFRLRVQVGERQQGIRINFLREVRSAGAARLVLIEMLAEARARLAMPPSPHKPGE
jgi:putative heme iron utilization protein